MSHRNISGIADQDNIDKWSDRATANSYSNKNKPGGRASEQTGRNAWFTPRERKDYTGPAGYPGSRSDRGGK